MPFEVNTTPQCIVIFLFEVLVTTFILNIFGLVITLLFGLMIYMETCLLDIKLLFDQIDYLSGCRNSEEEILVRCKEAVELYGRLIQYVLNSLNTQTHFKIRFPILDAYMNWLVC